MSCGPLDLPIGEVWSLARYSLGGLIRHLLSSQAYSQLVTIIDLHPQSHSTTVTNCKSTMAQVFQTVLAALLAQAVLIRGDDLACGNNRPRDLEGTQGVFQSPNYPNSYPNNANCQWRVTSEEEGTTVRVEFEEFSTESGYDFVEIFDGPSATSPSLVRASGGKPSPVESTGSSLYIAFTTDSSVTDSGFRGKYLAEKACGANAPRVLTDSSGSINSPYFPESYGAGLRCNWTIVNTDGGSVTVDFESFDLEEGENDNCRWDYLEIYDGNTFIGRFCGNSIPAGFTSTSDEVQVFLRTDLAIELQGFKLNYFTGATPPSTVSPPATTTPVTGGQTTNTSPITDSTGPTNPPTTTNPTNPPTTIPPPQGLYLEMLLRQDIDTSGASVSPECAAAYAASMRFPLTVVIVAAENALGSTLCPGLNDVSLLGGNLIVSSTESGASVAMAAFLIPSSTVDFMTHHACSREIAAFIGNHSNWRDPIIEDIPSCPDAGFATPSFAAVATSWVC